jgi:ribonuclease R
MKQATYDIANVGHFGLASKAYLHFTSPIRRYPDLVVHRVVHEVLTARQPRRDPEAREKLAEAALASSIAERRAMEVERAIVDLYRTFMMKDHVGERFEGVVTAVVGSGLFVQLDAPFVDVLVRLEDLGPNRWEVDDDALRVFAARSGERIGLGDRMALDIVDAAILRRTVYGRRAGAGDGGQTRPREGARKSVRPRADVREQPRRDGKRHDSKRHDKRKAAPPGARIDKKKKGKGPRKKRR